MSAPILVAVDADVAALRDIEEALSDRYGRDYRIECSTSAAEALQKLQALADADDDVALVVAGERLDGSSGSELLEATRRIHPHARRALLVAWGDWGNPGTGQAIFDAISQGSIDHYMVRPSPPPDELFHSAISGMLLEWSESQRTTPHSVHIVGQKWEGRAYELREVLGRCALPHTFLLADSDEGRAIVEDVGGDAVDADGGFPIVVFPDGTVLFDPTNAQIAQAAGSPVAPASGAFDLVIVGAGPAGLSAAVYGASEGLATLGVDEGGVGGQATSSSLIRNYLGFPRGVSGRRLARQAYEQAWVFGAQFTFMQRVVTLARDDEGISLDLDATGRIRTRALLLATGASYQRLGIPELEALNGAGVYYGSTMSEAPGMADREVFVVGGANSAGQAALHLARYARHVTLVVRGDSLAASMSRYLINQIEATPRLDVRLGTEVVGGGGDGSLERLVLCTRVTRDEEVVPADGLFLMIGARPNTAWLPPSIVRDEQGFVLTGPDLVRAGVWELEREPFPLETSVPGVFAAGDVRHGSVKRVASAVGEGSVAIQFVHRFLEEHASDPALAVPAV